MMLLTMSKMKELDENLFMRAGITNFKYISTIFNRFTTATQDEILSEIFRLFFDNPFLN